MAGFRERIGAFLQGRSGAGEGPRPDVPFLAVGDIHGRADLLDDLQDRLTAERPGWPCVYLGDYVDRGPESSRVLDLLIAATSGPSPAATCLMGNHERMMLDFLDDPARAGRQWLRNGGTQTVASFDVTPPASPFDDGTDLERAGGQLAAAMGHARLEWLRGLPLTWRSGNVWAVHGGAAPARPMDQQSADVLLWGHPHFLKRARGDGQWVVHGHTIMEAPQARQGRISVDTGAYATNRLTAAAIEPGEVSFIQTGGG
jgi:serine/threonine protein phosphatase 1